MPFRTPNTNPIGLRVRDIPDGYEVIATVSLAWKQANDVVVAAIAERDRVADRLKELIDNSRFHENGCEVKPPHVGPGADPTLKGTNPLKLAAILIENPSLDYAAAANRIWGAGLPFGVAKNRVSTALGTLRRMGLVKTVGDNVHQVDPEKLATVMRGR